LSASPALRSRGAISLIDPPKIAVVNAARPVKRVALLWVIKLLPDHDELTSQRGNHPSTGSPAQRFALPQLGLAQPFNDACADKDARRFGPGQLYCVALKEPQSYPTLIQQTAPTFRFEEIRLSVVELPRPELAAQESTEQNRRDCSVRLAAAILRSGPLAGHDTNDVAHLLEPGPISVDPIDPCLFDVFVVPLAASAFFVKTLLRSALTLLVNILDGVFPIVMQSVRAPLFLARIIGDVVAATLKSLVWLLPLTAERQKKLREIIGKRWAQIRKYISYRAFEVALHQAFEHGMAWVFRTCRNLTPRVALFVICCAALWFPITFGTSTVLHAFLLSHATTLPAWMQLFHIPVVMMAKSKILVLPVYPAAWPQAKRHPIVMEISSLYRQLKCFALLKRFAVRYRQIEFGAQRLTAVLVQAPISIGLSRLFEALSRAFRSASTFLGRSSRTFALRLSISATRLSVVGPHVRRILRRYAKMAPATAARPSEQIRSVYASWAIKFTPGYYEAKEAIVHRGE
jgi:hypothetical protein